MVNNRDHTIGAAQARFDRLAALALLVTARLAGVFGAPEWLVTLLMGVALERTLTFARRRFAREDPSLCAEQNTEAALASAIGAMLLALLTLAL